MDTKLIRKQAEEWAKVETALVVSYGASGPFVNELLSGAADEIDRLRSENAKLREEIKRLTAPTFQRPGPDAAFVSNGI